MIQWTNQKTKSHSHPHDPESNACINKSRFNHRAKHCTGKHFIDKVWSNNTLLQEPLAKDQSSTAQETRLSLTNLKTLQSSVRES